MSHRSAVVGVPCLQPLRATVPYQLHKKTHLCKDVNTGLFPQADRAKSRPPKPSIRRTLSLDTVVGPYLQGQWPKEMENPAVTCVHDKATQTPSSWLEESRGRRSSGGHKRSASWGSAEHLKEVAKLRHQLQKRSRHVPPSAGCERSHHPLPGGHVAGMTQTRPLSRLAPRLRRSVEGLNLELEGVFVSEKPENPHTILDVPDGHRAPVPAQRCSSGSQSDPSPVPLDPSLISPSQSPCPLDPSLLSPSQSPCPLDPSLLSPSQSPCRLDPSLLSPSQSPCRLDPSLLSPSQSPCRLDPSLLSPSQSPCPLDPSLLSPSKSPCRLDPSHLTPLRSSCPLDPSLLSQLESPCYIEGQDGDTSSSLSPAPLDPCLLHPTSSSPRPSRTCSFQREPPEGCERVRICEEAMSHCQGEPLLRPSCPDPNKVNFTPHGGSAFCPVSLLKPLLPSMDLLFRGLSVSPVTGCPGQASSGHTVGGYLTGAYQE